MKTCEICHKWINTAHTLAGKQLCLTCYYGMQGKEKPLYSEMNERYAKRLKEEEKKEHF